MRPIKEIGTGTADILAAQAAGVDAEPLGDAPDAADSNGPSGIQADGESSFVVVAEKKTPPARLARTRLFSDAAAGAEHAQPFVPLSEKDIPERFEGAPVLPFAAERRLKVLLNRERSIELYQRWKDGELELNPVENAKVILEVEIRDQGIPYTYYYPIDLGYLFSPQWRQDNISSPSGLFRWTVEMDLALRLNMVKGYEGMRLGNNFFLRDCGKIKTTEGTLCGYKGNLLPFSKLLYLQTFLCHHANRGTLAPFLGNNNQVILAKEMGISHLGHFSLASLTILEGKPWNEILKYNGINLPSAKVEALLKELEANWKEYVGNNKQIALAKKVGIGNLGHLFSALTNLTNSEGISWAEVLGYNQINLPCAKAETLLSELNANWNLYRGNHRQTVLAKKIGISHLSHLFTALTNLTDSEGTPWASVLGYNHISIPCSEFEALIKELETNWKKYIGNNKQILLAKRIGVGRLDHFFSALSHLTSPEGKSWTEVLEYKYIDLSVSKAEILLRELNDNWENYIGNDKQIELAQKVGISRLDQLFSALSNLTNSEGRSWAKALGHNQIDLSCAEVKTLLDELEAGWERYAGNNRQTNLAKAVGVSGLGQLFSALSNLADSKGRSWAEVLGYRKIDLPRAKVEALLRELNANWEDYRGNRRQTVLAKKVNISYLGHLFSAISSLTNPEGRRWSAVLGYNAIGVPLKKIGPFFEEFVSFVETSHTPYYRWADIFRKLTTKECHQKFLEISRSFSAVKQYINSVKREDWPESFYVYLIRTLPLIYSGSEAITAARKIVEYIETNQQGIETTLGSLGGVTLTYEALRTHFGEFTIPVVKFFGDLIGIKFRNGGLRERLASSLPIPGIDKKRMDAFADKATLTPLEVALIREEQAQVAVLTEALVELSADEQVIVRRVFYEGEDVEAVAISFRMDSAAFQRKLDEILSKLKELMGY